VLRYNIEIIKFEQFVLNYTLKFRYIVYYNIHNYIHSYGLFTKQTLISSTLSDYDSFIKVYINQFKQRIYDGIIWDQRNALFKTFIVAHTVF
jgi:hypothetical protein